MARWGSGQGVGYRTDSQRYRGSRSLWVARVMVTSWHDPESKVMVFRGGIRVRHPTVRKCVQSVNDVGFIRLETRVRRGSVPATRHGYSAWHQCNVGSSCVHLRQLQFDALHVSGSRRDGDQPALNGAKG